MNPGFLARLPASSLHPVGLAGRLALLTGWAPAGNLLFFRWQAEAWFGKLCLSIAHAWKKAPHLHNQAECCILYLVFVLWKKKYGKTFKWIKKMTGYVIRLSFLGYLPISSSFELFHNPVNNGPLIVTWKILILWNRNCTLQSVVIAFWVLTSLACFASLCKLSTPALMLLYLFSGVTFEPVITSEGSPFNSWAN